MPLAQSGGIYPSYQPLPTLSAPSSSTRRTWSSGARCSALFRIPFAILFSVVHGISRYFSTNPLSVSVLLGHWSFLFLSPLLMLLAVSHNHHYHLHDG